MSIIIMLALISILIIAHEMGHFFVARRCGVKVERFGFGLPFGPTLWSKKVGDTEYCLHALLFGGYVAFPDDSPDSDIPADSTERFENQPAWNRVAIAVAGVTVNAILGWAIMVFVIMNWGLPNGDLTVGHLLSDKTPAAIAGLKDGDVFVSFDNGKPLMDNRPIDTRREELHNYIKTHANQTIVLTVKRGDQQVTVHPTPNASGMIGFEFGHIRKNVPEHNPLTASVQSVQFLSRFVGENFKALGRIFTDFNPKELGGPIRIVDVGAQAIDKGGIQDGLILTAIVSTILAVMNLLPIPALDGGHILFITIEALRGRPVKKEVQEKFVQAGFMVLLTLMVFIFWNDINNKWINPDPQENASQTQNAPKK